MHADANVEEEVLDAHLVMPLCIKCVVCLLQADISQPVKHEEAEEDIKEAVVLWIEEILELHLAVCGGSVAMEINPVPVPILSGV